LPAGPDLNPVAAPRYRPKATASPLTCGRCGTMGCWPTTVAPL